MRSSVDIWSSYMMRFCKGCVFIGTIRWRHKQCTTILLGGDHNFLVNGLPQTILLLLVRWWLRVSLWLCLSHKRLTMCCGQRFMLIKLWWPSEGWSYRIYIMIHNLSPWHNLYWIYVLLSISLTEKLYIFQFSLPKKNKNRRLKSCCWFPVSSVINYCIYITPPNCLRAYKWGLLVL